MQVTVRDMAVAVWNAGGGLLLVDREGVTLPSPAERVGLRRSALAGEPWRVYYLQSPAGQWLVACRPGSEERDEVVFAPGSQPDRCRGCWCCQSCCWPWRWAVRRALAPIHELD